MVFGSPAVPFWGPPRARYAPEGNAAKKLATAPRNFFYVRSLGVHNPEIFMYVSLFSLLRSLDRRQRPRNFFMYVPFARSQISFLDSLL